MTSAEQDMMARFRRDYLDLLTGRVAKIHALVTARQYEPANVALLSLESSSAMVGSTELVAVVRQLRSALDQGRSDLMAPLLETMDQKAADARKKLADPPG